MTLISNVDAQAPIISGIVSKPNLTIASESPADFRTRERLLDEAFGVARFEKTVERLREGRLPAQGLALAAKDAGESHRHLADVARLGRRGACTSAWARSRSQKPIDRADLAASS